MDRMRHDRVVKQDASHVRRFDVISCRQQAFDAAPAGVTTGFRSAMRIEWSNECWRML
jgi:hypothetical protein